MAAALVALATGVGLVAVLAAAGAVGAQESGPAAGARINDAIFARKALMNAVEDNMLQIDHMISQNRLDLDDAHKRADTISVLLTAFPHLFPPGSNHWKFNADQDAHADTFASPDLWAKFADFYQRAAEAARIAQRMSRAGSADDVKARARELEIACDVCHSLYLETP